MDFPSSSSSSSSSSSAQEEPRQVPHPRHRETPGLRAFCQGALRTTWGASPLVVCPIHPSSPSMFSPTIQHKVHPSHLHKASACPHKFLCPSFVHTLSTSGFLAGIFPSGPQDPAPTLSLFVCSVVAASLSVLSNHSPASSVAPPSHISRSPA